MSIAFFKKVSMLSLLFLSIGCTSLQVEKSLDALGSGISDSVESRNENKPAHAQNHSPEDEDLINGILNMLIQGFGSLFSSDND
ncbi:hypothetical protein [Parashewanella tropica]|uniref:hypothetical protein n=1 Tax=Parashewanella tropica TaxID=2547970 RepID=UPI00105A60F4|nr:hypothetical protein [Parashewanella tropica]